MNLVDQYLTKSLLYIYFFENLSPLSRNGLGSITNSKKGIHINNNNTFNNTSYIQQKKLPLEQCSATGARTRPKLEIPLENDYFLH